MTALPERSHKMQEKAAKVDESTMMQAMDAATADVNHLPGCVAVVIDKNGETLFQHASGKRGACTSEAMTLDNVFWLASCTKMVCGIAALQLVEQGNLCLDDADSLERIAPELKNIRILKGFDSNGRPELIEKKTRITLRMLLSHTAGFGYSYFNSKAFTYGLPLGNDEVDGYSASVLNQPLLHEPGTDWEYGVGIDWAGTMIERVSGMSLNEYLQTHIFAPLNLHHISMLPTPQMRAQLAFMNRKSSGPDNSSKCLPCEHPMRRPLVTPLCEQSSVYNSAGAGLFARPTEYAQIISVLLNDGVHAPTGNRILTSRSIAEAFTNQIPDFPNFGRKGIVSQRPLDTNDIPDFYHQPGNPPQGWGLTFMLTLHEGQTGRGGNTAWWAGLPNCYWWADREHGVGGILASQILPFAGEWLLLLVFLLLLLLLLSCSRT